MATSHEAEVALGRRFVDAIASKNTEGLAAVLDPQIDFRGITPGSDWRATSADGVAEIVFGSWFEPTDRVREVVDVETQPFAGRFQLRYRLRVENAEGMFVVEQQGYFSAERGRITRMSVVCSGFRPEAGST